MLQAIFGKPEPKATPAGPEFQPVERVALPAQKPPPLTPNIFDQLFTEPPPEQQEH